jgi:hypothetical protein
VSERETIIERIRKLLSLADEHGGGTEPERHAAVERAQHLMLKYQIEERELAGAAGRSALPGIESSAVGVFSRGQYWRGDLLHEIGKTVTVDAIFYTGPSGRRFSLVGRPDAIAYVRTLAAWIEPQLIRDCAAALDATRRNRYEFTAGDVRAFKRTFYTTAIVTIGDRLEAAGREVLQTDGGMALVRSDRAALKEFYGDDAPKLTEAAPLRDLDAMLLGQRAGQNADIDPNEHVEAGAARELSA